LSGLYGRGEMMAKKGGPAVSNAFNGVAPAPGERTRPPLIGARGLTFQSDGRRIVDQVDIEIHRGEIVTVIGPNGAGKTTLARLLLGLIKPFSGVIRLSPNLRVGYVPQRFAVDRVIPLTVRRFLTLGRRAAPQTVEEALHEVGIGRLADAQISSLSGGEFQRASLARALIGEPELLVLDEPVQAVDYAGEAQLYELISAISSRRMCGVLLISHDLHVVMSRSDRVICLNRHVCCEGAPERVTSDPEYARLFGPEAVRAVALYRHRHNHAHDLSGEIAPASDPAEHKDGEP
jgi:zinc transport system ATP-binding protein